MKIVTWNINSVRLRKNSIIKFLNKEKIDVICLQETKTTDDDFPLKVFVDKGYIYSYIRGEKSYNGVAVLSKIPIIKKTFQNFCKLNDTRHIKVIFENNIVLHNLYVPAGGDIPDIKKNSKFEHKINFMNEIIKYFKSDNNKSTIILGDLNIAPFEHDVWSHKQLLNVVSHSKIETACFNKLLDSGPYIDIIRSYFKPEDKIFSWWSYRNKDWKKSNRGRRLDHILLSKDLAQKSLQVKIYEELRNEEKPSDHVPVGLTMNI